MWVVVYVNGKRLSELIVVNLQDVMRMLWEGGERLSIRTKGDGVIEVDWERRLQEVEECRLSAGDVKVFV